MPSGNCPFLEDRVMRHHFLWILPLLCLTPALVAQDRGKEAKPATPAEQFQNLFEEVGKYQQEAARSYREAKTEAERKKIAEEFQKKPQEYAGRFLELARKYPKEPDAFNALAFVLSNTQGPEADIANQ